ncbi:PF07209 family protein [Bordetella bronchiseptica OSU553]|nr:PF07209 family protein [Bordetella bronchiseptica OSU553]
MIVDVQTGAAVAAEVRLWVDKAVIGLNLCPFAKAVQAKGQVRYAVSDATDAEGALSDLEDELMRLSQADPQEIDTTLLILPDALDDFYDFNDFEDLSERLLKRMRLVGELQVATFHPRFQFAETGPDDIENYTNRSPYPILHLLREASIDKAVEAFPDAAEIYEKNIETMRELGEEGWRKLME